MLKVNFLVAIYFFLSSCFIILSKNKKARLEYLYLTLNAIIIFLLFIPFFYPINGSFRVFFDWFPLATLPLAHRETTVLSVALGISVKDGSFIAFENKYLTAIIRFHDQNKWSYFLLSEFLHLSYLSFFFFIYGLPLYLYLQGDMLHFYQATFAMLCLLFSCFITHGLVPVYGPRNIFEKISDQRSHGFFFRLVHTVLEKGATPRTAFPSGHAGLASVVLLICYTCNVSLFYVVSPVAFGLIISTIYGRFHYGVDVVFGFIYAVIAFLMSLFVFGMPND